MPMNNAQGLEDDAEGRINSLIDLLSDKYSRSSILKELIQNADDAGAEHLFVGSATAPEHCRHELLADGSLGVFVLNDGPFTRQDATNIRKVSRNDKAGDAATIGKFGLGLKSVFHLCEAFFWLSPGDAADNDANSLLNPWMGTEHHPAWRQFDPDDLELLRRSLQPLLQRLGQRWFGLWLPLRKADYKCPERILENACAAVPEELQRPDVSRLAAAMPLLKQLRVVELDHGQGAGRPQWSLTAEAGRTRYFQWTKEPPGPSDVRVVHGSVAIQDEASYCLDYVLAERWVEASWVKTCQDADDWPTRRTNRTKVPDKALPHAAVVLAKLQERDSGLLHQSDAVFLPLGDTHTSAGIEFYLLLHGCFFVDSGRGGIYTRDGVRGVWNDRLMREGVLPLVVSAVARLADVCRDGVVTRRLTAALEAWMDGQDRRAVCRDGGWAYRWRPGGSNWEKIETGEVYEIPGLESDELRAFAAPAFAELSERFVLIQRGEPRLLAREPDPWPDELVAALLTTLRRVFGTATRSQLDTHRETLRDLLSLIPSQRRRVLSLGGNWPDRTRQAVCGVEGDILIVPDGYAPEHSPGTGRFPATDAVSVLNELAAGMSEGQPALTAAQVIAAAEDANRVREETADLRLWRVEQLDGARVTPTLATLNTLRRARAEGALFVGAANEFQQLASAVGVPLTLTRHEIRGQLFPDDLLPGGDTAGVLAMLCDHAPRLSPDPARRAGLLTWLMNAASDESFHARRRWAVRYLIHGNRDLSAGDDVFLPAAGAGVIGKVVRAVLERKGQAGRLLQSTPLTELLTDAQRRDFGVVTLDWGGLARLLEGEQDVPGLAFDDAERDELLDGMRNDAHAIRLLPLHDRADGSGRVGLSHGCYWRDSDGVELDDLINVIVLLKPHPKPALATIQQEAGGKKLTYREVVDLVIQNHPDKHWRTLLSAMASAGTLSDKQVEKLTAKPWLPTAAKLVVSPHQVLYDEDMNDEIAAAVKRTAASAGDLVPYAQLDPDVRNHKGINALKRLFPDRGEMLQKLGGLLGRDPQFHVGKIDDMDAWCGAFQHTPFDMAAAPLVIKFHVCAPDECKSHLLPNLSDTPTIERLEKVLAFLRSQHASANGPRATLQKVHDSYLKLAAASPTFQHLLPQLKLLNTADPPMWVPARRLCAGVVGVDPNFILDATQDGMLGDKVARQAKQDLPTDQATAGADKVTPNEREFAESFRRLEKYFKGWRASELLSAWAGAFLCLLGDDERIRALAKGYLPSTHAIDLIRTSVTATGKKLTKQMHMLPIRVVDPRKPVEVCNLLGELKTVPAATSFTCLHIGQCLDVFGQVNRLNLRACEPNDSPAFQAALAETGNYLLRHYHKVSQSEAAFDQVLSSFRGDDYGVRFAQEGFLDEGGNALRNRGLTRSEVPALRSLYEAFKLAEQQNTHERIAERKGNAAELPGEPARKLAEDARERLRQLIEKNGAVQAEFLNGVKGRLTLAGYSARSVLFELFQNADDAYVEAKVEAGGHAWFECNIEPRGVFVSHTGRPINRPEREDAYDLKKMLALHHSDKSEGVTGRFGLGFKSVLFVCDEPRIVCGQLAVRVVGGSYPIPLSATEAPQLRQRVPTATDKGTIFHLPTSADNREWCESFRHLAHLLPVFARRIRTVKLDGQEFAWVEETSPKLLKTVVLGTLNVQAGPKRVMVIRCGEEHGDVLFGLNDTGFVAMPHDVPSVWVTVPTTENHSLGYVVNARQLHINIGRSLVAWEHPHTQGGLSQLAAALGDALVALTGNELPQINQQEFWKSFWTVVSAKGVRHQLRDGLMWGPHGAARRLYNVRPLLPTELHAPGYSDLTCIPRVRGTVCGLLDDEERLRSVARWPAFSLAYPSGTLVASSVAEAVGEEWPVVDLVHAVALETRAPNILPERATALGQAINRRLLGNDLNPEVQRLEVLLDTVRFESAAGSWLPARELTVQDVPDEQRLSPEYTGTGLEFFLACGGRERQESGPFQPPPPAPGPNATTILQRIAVWWGQNRATELASYYARIFPGGRRPVITATGSLRGTAVRMEWLKLLVVGSLQTIGRVEPEQNRDFVGMCEQRGWLRMLADGGNDAIRWLAGVRDYVDDENHHGDTIQYFYWLRNYIGIDTIARHLDTYTTALSDIDRFRQVFGPSHALTPRGPTLQGTALSAPPMQPFLGIGAHFVFRELMRSGVVTRTDVHPYCYPPVRQLRERLERLGWRQDGESAADRSRSIHGFLSEHLEDPTFGGDFDIPLLMWPDWDTVPLQRRTSADGDFVTLGNGRVIPRSYMS